MTVQEALMFLEIIATNMLGNSASVNDEKLRGLMLREYDALDTAIEALEKQIPKKVLYREQSYGTPWLCPECEADQIKVEFFREDGYEPKEKHSYCWKCGQKLDWGD